MRSPRAIAFRLCLSFVAAFAFLCQSAAFANETAQEPLERLTLVVPAAPGGGWDLTAQSMRRALLDEEMVRDVEIVHIPGAGGLVGLAQFAAQYRSDPNAMLVGGLVLLSSTIRDESAVTLRDVVPLARLAGEWGVIAVPVDSHLRDVRSLRSVLMRDHGALNWAGGALGGPDQALVWSLARAHGVSLDEISYYGRPGGRRVAESLAERRHNIGTGGYAEFAEHVAAGKLRVLAVAAPARLPDVEAPTLKENGLDVAVMNWRAVFGAPDTSAVDQARLLAMLQRLSRSATWKRELARNRWDNSFLPGLDFRRFLEREHKRWPEVVDPPVGGASSLQLAARTITNIPVKAAFAFGLLALLAGGVLVQDKRQKDAEARELQTRCRILASKVSVQTSVWIQQVRESIFDEFGEWNLSSAERDVAWFMLRGLPLKEIADLRGTSERTVRQQAQSVYRKAGLEGRSDLAGRVLERFI